MTDSKPRYWGIDAIGGLYALAAMLLFLLFLPAPPLGQLIGLGAAALCGLVSVGMFRRIDIIRKLLMVLLALAILGDILLLLYFVAADFGAVERPPNLNLGSRVTTLAIRLGLAVFMYLYLWRDDVKNEFRGNPVRYDEDRE
jgi:hypothetical protein